MSSSAVVYVGSATAISHDLAKTPTLSDDRVDGLQASNIVRLQRGPDGLFHMRVTFDGVPTTAILDTGASHSVISKTTFDRLTHRSGKKFANSQHQGVMLAMSGRVHYRLIPIEAVNVEGFDLGKLQAATIDSPNVPTLLGQDAIARFNSVTIKADELILR